MSEKTISKKTIIVSLKESEYKAFEKQAYKKNLKVTEYAQQLILSEATTVDTLLDMVKKEINRSLPGREFTIRELFGPSWESYSVELRIQLGRKIIRLVKEGKLKSIKALNKDSRNSQIYLKKHKEEG